MFYCFMAFGFTNSQTYELSNINEQSIKKEKGQLSNIIELIEVPDRNTYLPTPLY